VRGAAVFFSCNKQLFGSLIGKVHPLNQANNLIYTQTIKQSYDSFINHFLFAEGLDN